MKEWKGSRTMLIAYTPQCLGKLSYKDIKTLDEHGFPPPLSQLPEAFGGQPQAYLSAIEPHERQSPNPEPSHSLDEPVAPELEEEDWEVYLDLEDGEVMLGGEFGLNIDGVCPQVAKTEVSYTANVEQILQQLTSPLEVTYTVDPREVLQSLPLWEPAIRKEVNGVEIAIQRLLPDTAERSAWLSKPGIQRLPTKFVFTVKPNDKAVLSDPTTWWKRKARLVACGNYAQSDGSNLYAESAPAEAVRAGLTLTCKQCWEVGIIDVIAAFLKTPIGRKATDPKIVVAPPKLLEKLGMTVPLELWGLVRALCGLRQSPALWSDYRDDMIAQLRLPDGLRLSQGQTVRCWWSIVDKNGTTVGVLIVYVDDFMLCGSRPVVELLSKAIREMWETSELSMLSSSNPIRFLGMELTMVPQEENTIYVSQYGYIQELLRHHDLPETRLDKVPVSKELSSFSVVPSDVAADDYMVHQAQQVTGEILWVSQRSRPDLSYTSALMSTLTTRAPYRVVEIGLKALGYLRRTAKYQLRVSWSESPLTMFCDAAYAPQSERSHAGWLVAYGQVPLVWRSSRQQMITLSTAEAELLALTDGAVALKGVECLLADLGERVTSRELASDSSAALGISQGAASWRTRHLRIRAGWLVEQIQHGLMSTRHCPGEFQPADLLTKPLSSQRLRALLQLWKIGEPPSQDPKCQVSRMSMSTSRITVALVCCLLMMTVEASENPSQSTTNTGVKIDADMLTVFMMMVMLLGLIMMWEGIKWIFWELMLEWTPGSRSRKLRRLEKLREATAKAIQEEIAKIEAVERPTSTSTTTSSSARAHREAPEDYSSATRGPSRLGESSSSMDGPTTEIEALLRRRATAMSSPPRPTMREATSPALSTPTAEGQEEVGDQEYLRVCVDVASLMRCEELKEALRHRGLRSTGLKSDLVAGLGYEMWTRRSSSNSPTIRQYKYLLWLWRHKDLSGRVLLKIADIEDKTAASRTISSWKNLAPS